MAEIPKGLAPISSFVKIANEYKNRDIVIYYWTLFHAAKQAMELSKDSKESTAYLVGMLDELENVKKQHPENESLRVDVAAQAHIEQQAAKLFNFADNKDRNGEFNKNTIKAFYAAGHLFDVLAEFGEPDDAVLNNRKYAKWKATYINNCLKNGETPVSGPPPSSKDEDDELMRQLIQVDDIKPTPPPRSSPPNSANTNVADSQKFGWSDIPFEGPFSSPNSNTYNQPATNSPYPTPYSQPGSQYPGQFFNQPFNQPNQPSYAPQPYQPPAAQPQSNPSSTTSLQSSSSKVSLENNLEARRFCKMACSALDYEDAKTAIEFMEKALAVLRK
ncbi:unnamed protein product [Bursaphelenchus okinawaensis]|uniref:Uncharacterized protein n=1 Tax=Bursaphelenchus okinawaensis TaxID=465554 RepID=A0A811LIE4_9BILA|nr:unnamed protein product [Bursaphelenchus okinawaensis]CAG9126455.1 unnamed protein product [Bursaphelenchus okinawaensis]